MKPWQRLLYYLVMNIIVSALTTWVVLTIWDKTHLYDQIPASSLVKIPVDTPAGNTTFPAVSPIVIPAIDTPTFNVKEYQVQPNDTMGDIAVRFGVTVEELLKVNALKNAEQLSVGMVLFIPITPEAVSTGIPAIKTQPVVPAGTPVARSDAGVIINSVIGAGDLGSERVFLSRTGSGVLAMAGWKLMDEDGNVFTFPNLELFEGGAVNVWTTQGTPTVIDLFWGLQNSVWESGERVTILDAEGNVEAVYQIP